MDDLESLSCDKIFQTDMNSFLSAVRGLQSLQLSAVEQGYLRAVALLKHGSDILDQMEINRDIIAAVADQAHVALAQSMLMRTENNPLQFAKMMMILAGLENIPSDFLHHLFFKDVIGDISMDIIVVDMLKNKT